VIASTDQLTPYLETFRLRVDRAFRALLGISPDVALTWEARCDDRKLGTGRLRLAVSGPEGDVEIALALVQRKGVVTLDMARPRLAYRSVDELARSADYRFFRRISAEIGARSSAVVAQVVDAVGAWWQHEGLGDWMYRQITGSGHRYATLRLGFRCNQRCGFCWQGRAWPDPPPALLRQWIVEVAALGLGTLTFSGGEPTLHPDLVELTRLAYHEYHLEVVIQTNAIRLRDVAYLEALIDAGVGSIFVSYHSADPAVSDAMTHAPGTHRRTREGIETCLRTAAARGGNPQVRLNCVVERSNAPGLPDLARDVVERFVRPFGAHGVRSVEFSYPNLSFDRERWVDAVAPLDEVRGPLIEAARLLRAAGVEVILFTGCGFPICAAHGAPELLDTVILGDLDTMDVEGRRWPDGCTACSLKPACLGLRREYLEVHGARGIVPFGERSDGGGR